MEVAQVQLLVGSVRVFVRQADAEEHATLIDAGHDDAVGAADEAIALGTGRLPLQPWKT